MVLLLVAGTSYASGVAAKEWAEMTLDVIIVVALVFVVFNGLRRTVRVRENRIRKVQLVWPDSSVQTSEIRRVHGTMRGKGLWSYTDLDGDPALKVGSRLEDTDELEELVI
ncbi:hypothetical protein [Salinibacter ruber]|uniref:hypothetical protein n=1 Tax=Salinibacter ruber TaxID=146919 RepID=UPI002166E002|nr:hypothetical protein [Salinibacter ruber]